MRKCTLVGSSRRIRDVAMYSSRTVNQPLGLNQVLVCVGEGGILKKVTMPIRRVSNPLVKRSKHDVTHGQNATHSIRNSHLAWDESQINQEETKIERQSLTANQLFLERLACEGRRQQGNWQWYYRRWKKTKTELIGRAIHICCRNLIGSVSGKPELADIGDSLHERYRTRSGMKPPCRRLAKINEKVEETNWSAYPRRALQSKNVDLPVIQNWDIVMIAHPHIWIGIQRSGPSCDKLDVNNHIIMGSHKETNAFWDQLGWKLSSQEGQTENSVAQVEVWRQWAGVRADKYVILSYH